LSRQTIDIGVTPNDGTGDPIRTAMIKINDNFEEVYGSWTVTGPLVIASDTSNTTITDKKIAVNRVEIPGNVVINTTGLNVNGSNYITSNGISGSALLVGQCIKSDGLTIVVNNFVGTNTTINGNSVTACTFLVPGGFTIDSTGIKAGNATAITANTIVTANVTVGNVNINPSNINVKGAIVGVGYLQAPSVTAQDIVANSTVRVGGITTLTPSAIQTNGLGIGNVAVTVETISVGGSDNPKGGTFISPTGIVTSDLTVNGAILADSLRAKTLNVDEQVIDKIIADTLQVGQAGSYSYIDGTSITAYNAIFNTANLYNLSVNNNISIANAVFISSFEISTPSLNSRGPMIANTLVVNNSINANNMYIGGVTSITNNGITTNKMNITDVFQADSASFRNGMDVGNGRINLYPSGVINCDSITISKSISIDESVGNVETYSISMNADGSFRTGQNKLDFLVLNMGANNIVISQNTIAIANSLFISNNNMGEMKVGGTLVNSTVVVADNIIANANFSAKAISIGDLTNNTNINSTSIETNLVISNNMLVTNASIGGVSMKANALTVGAARVDANSISISGAVTMNTSGIITSANLVVNGNIGVGVNNPTTPLYIKEDNVANYGQVAIEPTNKIGQYSIIDNTITDADKRITAVIGDASNSNNKISYFLYRDQVSILSLGGTGSTPGATAGATSWDADGNMSMGYGGKIGPTISLFNATNINPVSIKAGVNINAWQLTLPTSGGTPGQVLSTDGSGATSWTSTVTNATQLGGRVAGSAANNIPVLDNTGKIPAAVDKIIISSNDPDPAQGDQNWIWFKV
jgi:hypothetical protein